MDSPIPPIPASPTGSSDEALAKADSLAKEGPIPHPSKRLWVLAGLAILILGILMGYLAPNVLNQSKKVSDGAATPSQKSSTNFSQLASPTPTIDPTIDWKTYTNNTFHYSFKYPISWTFVSETESGVGIAPNLWKNEGYSPPITMGYLKNPDKLSLAEYDKKNFQGETSGFGPGARSIGSEPKIIGTTTGFYKEKTHCEPLLCTEFILPFQNTIFIFRSVYNLSQIDTSQKLIFDQILSTFHFLDAVSPTPTTTAQSTPIQSNGAELKGIRYTLPANWAATVNADNLHLAPKSGGGYLYIEVFNYPGTTGRREYYCQLHKYCITETEFTDASIGNIAGYKATRLDNSGGGEEYFGAKGNKFYIISTYSPPAPNDFDAVFESVLSSLIF